MPYDKYAGIHRALTLALRTGQSVNVGLNRDGEAVKIEGWIKHVYGHAFLILLEEGPTEDIVCLSEVEYVEYS